MHIEHRPSAQILVNPRVSPVPARPAPREASSHTPSAEPAAPPRGSSAFGSGVGDLHPAVSPARRVSAYAAIGALTAPYRGTTLPGALVNERA